ncbi:MAG: methyltransferase domain-containing protein [Jatrophihabitantaceae bacterium]
MEGALSAYEGALRQAGALSLLTDDGIELPLAISRYLADADPVDQTVLDASIPPVLDVGCGPGRIVHALSSMGKPALGVDIASVAVTLARRRGAPALIRSVFQRLPGEGRWPTVLLLDGNIGIGGDVAELLNRLTAMIAPAGTVIIEASSPDPEIDRVLDVRFAVGGAVMGPQFPWAVVGSAALIRHACRAGLALRDYWSAGGRVFLQFGRNGVAARDTSIR